MRYRNFLILAAAAALSSCATLSGKASLAELSAPLAGGLLAGDFGANLDSSARNLAARTEYRALEGGLAGSPVSWKASNSVYGSVTPQQAFSVGSTNCRRYTHAITQNGVARSAEGTACRDESGVWRPLA